MKNLSRRKILCGGAAIAGITAAGASLAKADQDEVRILRKAVDEEINCKLPSEKYLENMQFIRHYPVKTVEGLAQKLRWVWGHDCCNCINLIEADIYRLAGQKVPEINFFNSLG